MGDQLESYQQHARPLIERGHTVLLRDVRGHGGSEGRFTTLGGKESEDVRTAIVYLRRQGLADSGIVLMGHSMGAVAVLLAAAEEPELRAVIVEAPYDTFRNTTGTNATGQFEPVVTVHARPELPGLGDPLALTTTSVAAPALGAAPSECGVSYS